MHKVDLSCTGQALNEGWSATRRSTPETGGDPDPPVDRSLDRPTMLSASGLTVSSRPLLEQDDRVELYPACDPLQALERQVPLASLQAAHVGAVHAKNLGKSLLAEAQSQSAGPQVAPDGPLKVAFHIEKAPALLLDGLQTHQEHR